MVSEIRIYVEGGGDTPRTQLPLREGFSKFLMDLKSIADQKRIGFSIIACGARGNAKNDFFEAIGYLASPGRVGFFEAEVPSGAGKKLSKINFLDRAIVK